MNRKKILLIIATTFLVVTTGCMVVEARLAPAGVQNDRQAVVNEANYAITGVFYKIPIVTTINGDWNGDWNYLNSDLAAIAHTKAKWPYPVDGEMTYASDPVMRSYFVNNDIASYGNYDDHARGGECLYFANLILYRAGVFTNTDPIADYDSHGNLTSYGYRTMNKSKTSTKYAKPGDVIFKYMEHTAIVTDIIAGDSVKGTVTSVRVVDSNYLGSNVLNGTYAEKIGTHIISDEAIDKLSAYSVWTGTPYYNYPYNPTPTPKQISKPRQPSTSGQTQTTTTIPTPTPVTTPPIVVTLGGTHK